MTTYRSFRISINIFYYRYNGNSKIYTIKSSFVLVLLSIWFSLISIFFCLIDAVSTLPFAGKDYTFEAVKINISGGIDYSKVVDESEYDDKTDYVWNNLHRETLNKIDRSKVEIIVEIQEDYEQLNKEKFTEDNINYIISEINKVEVLKIRTIEMQDVIKDIFNAMKTY